MVQLFTQAPNKELWNVTSIHCYEKIIWQLSTAWRKILINYYSTTVVTIHWFFMNSTYSKNLKFKIQKSQKPLRNDSTFQVFKIPQKRVCNRISEEKPHIRIQTNRINVWNWLTSRTWSHHIWIHQRHQYYSSDAKNYSNLMCRSSSTERRSKSMLATKKVSSLLKG